MGNQVKFAVVMSLAFVAFTFPPAFAAEPEIKERDPALRWLSEQQQDDGGWTFAAEIKAEDKPHVSSTEATGLALLAFLSAGQSHREGAFKK